MTAKRTTTTIRPLAELGMSEEVIASVLDQHNYELTEGNWRAASAPTWRSPTPFTGVAIQQDSSGRAGMARQGGGDQAALPGGPWAEE